MTRVEKFHAASKNHLSKLAIILTFSIIAILISLYFYAKTQIVIETPQQDLGEKVVVELPSGKRVFTYENLVVQEDDKLLYKGERNTLDLTGGVVIYKDWK
ncbi:hypothetical protein [Cytobacillus purgationiresistens]|uniref:Uncharacterized protein n=1 Tax=Cytobacillus purgationiresistens TaxID=863449 RepID=A0ABU0AHZ3_9BACI|nr:hypothetical protein [Cytobacillus purgationiresistens]MDQ0270842.1 hypothetical protein [Cytobacillus purgationiresistens]